MRRHDDEWQIRSALQNLRQPDTGQALWIVAAFTGTVQEHDQRPAALRIAPVIGGKIEQAPGFYVNYATGFVWNLQRSRERLLRTGQLRRLR